MQSQRVEFKQKMNINTHNLKNIPYIQPVLSEFMTFITYSCA